jgi:molybdopterin-containing oxidoreductase family iron-sulfur binding subunit
MSINRREFFKIVGFGAVMGLSGATVAAAVKKEVEATGPYMTDPKGLAAKRWAMSVDMSKFKSDADVQKCIDACHQIHNVPDIGNTKERSEEHTSELQSR